MPKKSQVKVLGIGEAVIDSVILVDDLNDQNEVDVGSTIRDVGGPILSALIVLARLGVDCTFVTSLGEDEGGKKIKALLEAEKIKLVNFPQSKTKHNLVLVSKKNGQRKKIKGHSNQQLIKNLDTKFIKSFSHILLDRHQPQAFSEVVEKKESTAKIIIDPSVEVSDFTLEMVRHSDYPIIPFEFVNLLKSKAKGSSLLWLYNQCQKKIIVTAGEKGSYIFDGQESQIFPIFKVDVLDVTGAGDTFRGAFTYGLIQGWSIEKSVQFGNYVAALQCRKIGNVGAIPSAVEMSCFNSLK